MPADGDDCLAGLRALLNALCGVRPVARECTCGAPAHLRARPAATDLAVTRRIVETMTATTHPYARARWLHTLGTMAAQQGQASDALTPRYPRSLGQTHVRM
jgi:hypothetical protein